MIKRPIFFDKKTHKLAHEAAVTGQWNLLYAMVPAMDGGQTYEMKCKICGEFGNVLAKEFIHAEGCPVDIEEKKSLRQRKRLSLRQASQWILDKITRLGRLKKS